MLLGFPGLLRWTPCFDRDDDGNVWVQVRRLGVTLLAEGAPEQDGEEKALRALWGQVLSGPAVEQVEPFWCGERKPGESANLWVCDDGCEVG
jgi:hypothetical protein